MRAISPGNGEPKEMRSAARWAAESVRVSSIGELGACVSDGERWMIDGEC